MMEITEKIVCIKIIVPELESRKDINEKEQQNFVAGKDKILFCFILL
jgi:hypothetical protein